MIRMIFPVVPILLALPLAGPTLFAREPVDFDRQIAPLLIRRCLDCHSGAGPKGDLDLAVKKAALATVTPGKPDDSALWQRVRDDEMPPKKPLSAEEKNLLRRWIADGARWGSDPVDPFRHTTDSRAGYDWWSLRPLRPVQTPAASSSPASNPVDRFLLARLNAQGLAFSPPADRRTLIRRVTFDLTGLPPTWEETSDFLADTRPDAYERLVDRLLASPAYGERQARHWLDLVRFGESDGFERDLPRFNAWPYRDWVARAFNDDTPYDRFARLQLAGDALEPQHRDSLAATGFLVAGAHDIVVPASEPMKATMVQDELEDLIATVGQTFLGLTVHCSRCHDHKFDPISQRDYYRLAAALGGVRHGERSFSQEASQVRLARFGPRLRQVQESISSLEDPVRRRLIVEKRGKVPPGPEPMAEWDFTRGLQDLRGSLHGTLHGSARRTSEGLLVDGQSGYASTVPISRKLQAQTLEAWVKLDNLQQRGGGVMTVQTLDGNTFDSIVYGEQEQGRWMSGSNVFERTRSLGGPVEKDAKKIVHVAITHDADGTITAYRDGQPYGQAYRPADAVTYASGQAQVVFGVRHTPAGGNRMLRGIIVKARLYDRALAADEVARSAGLPRILPEEIPPRLSADARERHARLCQERDELSAEQARLQAEVAQRIYAVNSQPVGPTHVLARGSVTARRELVQPGEIAALTAHVGTAGSPPEASEAQRRVALADWITAPGNPLFSRVMVNRLWQWHFGVGIVDTPSDLGFNGGRPSHPDLLDWLAREFQARKMSIKSMHRLLVTSTAYRQASRPVPEAMAKDADNRLLWRKSPQRLEAESIRDAVLTATDKLDRRMGGPSYLDFKTYFFKGTQFYDPLQQVGPEFHRRSLYRMGARGGRNPFLEAFDCPDPSASTPRRAVTTTPLQALALLNNAFVLDQAKELARQVRDEAGDDPGRQIHRAYQRIYGRDPEPEERATLQPFVRRHGLEALARVLFNSNEYIQIE